MRFSGCVLVEAFWQGADTLLITARPDRLYASLALPYLFSSLVRRAEDQRISEAHNSLLTP